MLLVSRVLCLQLVCNCKLQKYLYITSHIARTRTAGYGAGELRGGRAAGRTYCGAEGRAAGWKGCSAEVLRARQAVGRTGHSFNVPCA
jgi:hypothetical protein